MIKHGVRVPRGAYRIPRPWLLAHTRAVPIDRSRMREVAPTINAVSVPEGREINYRVAVVYILKDGGPQTFQGTFLARNAKYAEHLGKNFVTRYIRPSRITDVVATQVAS